jgi:hypothetical protein
MVIKSAQFNPELQFAETAVVPSDRYEHLVNDIQVAGA